MFAVCLQKNVGVFRALTKIVKHCAPFNRICILIPVADIAYLEENLTKKGPTFSTVNCECCGRFALVIIFKLCPLSLPMAMVAPSLQLRSKNLLA